MHLSHKNISFEKSQIDVKKFLIIMIIVLTLFICKAGKLLNKSVLSKLRCQTWMCFFPFRYPPLFILSCVFYQLFTMKSTFWLLATRSLARNIYLIHNITNQNLIFSKCHSVSLWTSLYIHIFIEILQIWTSITFYTTLLAYILK